MIIIFMQLNYWQYLTLYRSSFFISIELTHIAALFQRLPVNQQFAIRGIQI